VITAVLDDDPTGTQAVKDVPVILDWDDQRAWQAVRADDRSVHLLTNSRAHNRAEAAQLVKRAAQAAQIHLHNPRIVLRGDSTLRAHLWEEYEALRSVLAPQKPDVPLLLVPALPAAGRVTINGVQMIERDGARVPLDSTEYATDGDLSYSTAALAQWAQERSRGHLQAADAIHIPLNQLRAHDGATTLAAALERAASIGRPAAVVPDAETDQDLSVIATGLQQAERSDTTVIVRAAPAFAAVLTGTIAESLTPPPTASRVLVICGSFVPATTAQLAELDRQWPHTTVNASVAALAADDPTAELRRISNAAAQLLDRTGLAVVATDRTRDAALVHASSQQRIALALAGVARTVSAGVVIAKGGITSAVTALHGLGATAARVIGPVLPGVSYWRLPDGRDYLVVPGNVGGPELLAELVASIHVPATV
jgi:uncharacterized protein YgbK (DUF1537 family)